MPKYIDADKLMKQIRENGILPHDARKTLEAFLRMNEDELTADVRENVHGHWFFSEYEFFSCSICGNSYFNGCNSTAEAKERLKKKDDLYKYCPTCGAVMDEEES